MIERLKEPQLVRLYDDEIYLRMIGALDSSGIHGVALDIDDTLLDTEAVFARFVRETIVNIAAQVGQDERIVRAVFKQANTEAFAVHHVSPNRWNYVLKRVGQELVDDSRAFLEQQHTLSRIYSTQIPWHEGARELLWAIREIAGLPITLVTNANEEWTDWKVKTMGLDQYANHVVVVDQQRKKDKRDWMWAAELMEVHPLDMLGIGDSVPSDIKPLQEIGAMVIAIPSPVAAYRGNIGRVTQVERISQVPAALAAFESA